MDTGNKIERHGQAQLVPFLWIRRSVGFLGFILPVILVLGARLFGNCNQIQGSISDYYHTNMRDVFVVVLGLLSFSLFTYRGPDKADSIASNLASLCALGIIFFSTSIKDATSPCLPYEAKTCQTLHLVFAIGLFLTLSYFALVLFPKTTKGTKPTAEKLQRNKLYKTCGYIMLASIIIMLVYFVFLSKNEFWKGLHIIFYGEWLALWAFGLSWIVKGEWFILKDK